MTEHSFVFCLLSESLSLSFSLFAPSVLAAAVDFDILEETCEGALPPLPSPASPHDPWLLFLVLLTVALGKRY